MFRTEKPSFRFKLFKIVVFFFSSFIAFSQEVTSDAYQTLSAVICDSLTKQVMPLVKVYNSTQKVGTSSTFEGIFKLEANSGEDEITFYSLGFEKKKYFAKDLIWLDTVFLLTSMQLIDEVIIMANNSILHTLIEKCKNQKKNRNEQAKTYLEIESFNESDMVELIQGYYNGYYDGYDLNDLKSKNVRFGVRPKDKRLFSSISTSKVIYEHKLFEESELFPTNPFQMKRRNVRKKYDLVLNSKFKEEGRIIYVISFEPRDDYKNAKDLFSGTVWIDSVENKIQKVILEIKDAKIYPFESLFQSGKLSNVDMTITKSFQHINDLTRLNSVDFDYQFAYKIDTLKPIQINSRATLQAYDFNSSFVLPFYDFTSDYERANIVSELHLIDYDSLFWECDKKYKSSSDNDRNTWFFKSPSTIGNLSFLRLESKKAKASEKKISFANQYREWSGNTRIFLKDLSDPNVLRYSYGSVSKQLYVLSAQIYCNINENCDSVYYTTKTIFNPFETFYHNPITNEALIFINIYFDIMEIQRRKLNELMDVCKNDFDCLNTTYRQFMNETKRLTETYFSEVNQGIDQRQTAKWNEFVKANLAIDNIKLFREF